MIYRIFSIFLCLFLSLLLQVVEAATPVRKAPTHPASAKQTTQAPSAQAIINDINNTTNAGRQAFTAKKFTEAGALFQKAITLSEKYLGPNHKHVALYYSLLGEADFQQKDYEGAYKAFQRSFSLYSRPENKDEGQILYLLGHIGVVDMYTGRYAEAKTAFETLLPLEIKATGENSVRTKAVRDRLTDISHMQNGSDYINELNPRTKRWSDATNRVVVYIQDGSQVKSWRETDRNLVKEAYKTWETALDGRLQFEFTDNPMQSDTLLGWQADPGVQDRDGNEYGYNLKKVNPKSNILEKNNIVIALNSLENKPFSDKELYNTLLHEIGHSLGLDHSSNPADVMFRTSWQAHGEKQSLSPRDIATIKALYRMTPVATNPPGVRLVAYQESLKLKEVAGESFNKKAYQTAYNQFQQSLALYDNPNAHYYAGLAAWNLKVYDAALPHLQAAVKSPEYGSEAMRMGGFSAMRLAEGYAKQDQSVLANQYYGHAYNLFSQALQTGLDPVKEQNVQAQLTWLRQKLAR